MSTAAYTYAPKTFSVPERDSIRIDRCPRSIDEGLRRAGFDQEAENVFVKRQRSFGEGETEYRVATVRIDGRSIHVDVRHNVGVISLTPRAKLRIEPRIDWEYIFDMLLAVHSRRRSLDYHGVPLEEFRSEDVDLEDVFLILAVNYLNGLEAIHRNGFVRDLRTRRADLEQPRGVIDIERSLVNQAEGRVEQHCILKEVEYDNPANSLLHYAGIHLLRLFRQYEDEYDHQAYYRIFSQVHQEVRHLEGLGVDSNRRRMPQYQRFSLADLPKQRHYYERAVEVAKAVVASSLGTPAGHGDRELVVDYVMNMESLFEQYSQVAIEDELEAIRGYDHLDATSNVAAVRSPTVTPFEEEPDVYHQPDHAVEEGETTLAVLDSKYYATDHDPVRDRDPRAQLFGYAYLLRADRMGFLTPLNEPKRRTVVQTGAELEVISPDEGFSLSTYHDAVHDYLHGMLADRYPALVPFRAVKEHDLCLDEYDERALSRLTDPDGPFDFANEQEFSLRIVNAAADSLSREVATRTDLEQDGRWTRDQIETRCRSHDPSTTKCVPVFRRDRYYEEIELYFVAHDEDGTPTGVDRVGDFRLL